jgi:hypothetical protein
MIISIFYALYLVPLLSIVGISLFAIREIDSDTVKGALMYALIPILNLVFAVFLVYILSRIFINALVKIK